MRIRIAPAVAASLLVRCADAAPADSPADFGELFRASALSGDISTGAKAFSQPLANLVAGNGLPWRSVHSTPIPATSEELRMPQPNERPDSLRAQRSARSHLSHRLILSPLPRRPESLASRRYRALRSPDPAQLFGSCARTFASRIGCARTSHRKAYPLILNAYFLPHAENAWLTCQLPDWRISRSPIYRAHHSADVSPPPLQRAAFPPSGFGPTLLMASLSPRARPFLFSTSPCKIAWLTCQVLYCLLSQ
jgi:hypothetical protein